MDEGNQIVVGSLAGPFIDKLKSGLLEPRQFDSRSSTDVPPNENVAELTCCSSTRSVWTGFVPKSAEKRSIDFFRSLTAIPIWATVPNTPAHLR
jgi:hypothetical protein